MKKETNKFDVGVYNFAQIELPKSVIKPNETYYNNIEFTKLLINLANNSALHNAILSSKKIAITGGGFEYDEKDTKTVDYVNKCNEYETLEEVFAKLVYDYIQFGAFFCSLIKTKDKKTNIYHIPFEKMNMGKKNEKGKVEFYYYSEDWSKCRQAQYTPVAIPAYDPASKEPEQVLCVMEYRPGSEVPMPSYLGALSSIKTDAEISNFHLANIENGMASSAVINFTNGIPTPEERRQVENTFKEKFTGSDAAGKFIFTFSEDKERIPIISTITPADLDKQFIELRNSVLQNVLSGHKVTSPLLVGIRDGNGGLGSNSNELLTAYQLYDNTVLKPLIKIMQGFIDLVVELNMLSEITIKTVAPIEFTFSENVLTQIMTKDELRAKINLIPLTPVVTITPTTPQIIN